VLLGLYSGFVLLRCACLIYREVVAALLGPRLHRLTAPAKAPLDLVRVVDGHTELARHIPDEARGLLEPAAGEDDVSPALLEHLVRERAVLDPADSRHEQRCARIGDGDVVLGDSLADGVRELGLPGLVLEHELLLRVVAARGDIEEVDAMCSEQRC
jgi:hypothetical protein